jgi:PAS domain S-box-containing protein
MPMDTGDEGTSSSKNRAAGGMQPLSDAAQLLRVTLASIGDGVITTDPHGTITFLNPVAEALTGWTHEQAVGHALERIFVIVNEDTREKVENPALRALRDGLIVGLANHTLLIARDGTERPIDDSAAPIRSETGEVGGAVLVFRDITERRRQERLVKDAFNYAFNITNTLRHAFLVLDKDLRVVSANRAFYQRFKVSPVATEGRLVYELGNGQWNIPKLRELLEDVLPQNHSFEDFEIKHEFEDIGIKVMALNARRVNQPGNHSELILLVIEDITERRAAEQALLDSEVRYRRLFQSAKDGILILDAKTGKIIEANGFMSALVGLEAHELLGKELFEIGMFADEAANKAAFRELQDKRYLRYEHLPVQNQRGERVEVEFVSNVYQEDQTWVAQCNVRDIRQRLAMEKKIAAQTEQLVDESRRKDEFLAMLSHELRNPLAPIRSAVHLLRMQERGGENLIEKQAHDIIERQVGNLTKLVSDLLEVSRALSGRIRIDLQTVDLNEVLEHSIETVTPLIDHGSHVVTFHRCETAAWVSADPTRMEEVLVNLLGNAAKYTPNGGKIDVFCEQPSGTNYVQVRVRDNGVGIEPNLLPHVFDLFTQADRSLARSSGGLGIGLSLAHRIVDLHGGTINAKSPPDDAVQGTELIVRLGRTDAPAGFDAAARNDETVSAETQGQRVLVVDDNIDLVMMLASSLRQRGYGVQAAYTGPDGLKVALEWRPDMVILDIGLPGLDGYQVARELRAHPETKGVRLIALTGYGRDADITLAREAGFDAHIAKPHDFDDLEKLMTVPQT